MGNWEIRKLFKRNVYDTEYSAMHSVCSILNGTQKVDSDETTSICQKAIVLLHQADEQNEQLHSQSEEAYRYYNWSIINDFGICYYLLRDYEQAESYFCQAVDMCHADYLSICQIVDDPQKLLARCLSKLEEIYKEQKQDDKREKCLKELIDIYNTLKTNIRDSYMMDAMACSAELARLYYTQQRYKEAQTLLNTATPYLEEYVIEQSNYEYIHDLVNCCVTQELINEKMRN